MSDQTTTPTVGRLLGGTEGRDAIHFALAPVVAGCRLNPGQRATLKANRPAPPEVAHEGWGPRCPRG